MSRAPFLTEPTAHYRDSYLAALREFQAEGRHLDVDYRHIAAHFEAFVRDWLSRKSTRQASKVPETFFWLIAGGDDPFVGRLSLRHHLNERLLQFGGHIGYEIRPSRRRRGYGKMILRLGLEQAKALGIRRALVTCDADNIASAKIIEANGGLLENVILLPGRPVETRRYWIEIG
jgi:predicted acetyltransferase